MVSNLFEKYAEVKLDHFPRDRDEQKTKYLRPPPSHDKIWKLVPSEGDVFLNPAFRWRCRWYPPLCQHLPNFWTNSWSKVVLSVNDGFKKTCSVVWYYCIKLRKVYIQHSRWANIFKTLYYLYLMGFSSDVQMVFTMSAWHLAFHWLPRSASVAPHQGNGSSNSNGNKKRQRWNQKCPNKIGNLHKPIWSIWSIYIFMIYIWSIY